MSDTLIEKKFEAITNKFKISRPNAYSTPYFLRRNGDDIPFWGIAISTGYPFQGTFRVMTRNAQTGASEDLRVESADEIYHTTNRFISPPISGAYNLGNGIYDYNKIGITAADLKVFLDPNNDFNKLSNPLPTSSFLRINTGSAYQNTSADMETIRTQVLQKVNDINQMPDESYGTKNLLYFTVFRSREYVQMLDLCLRTIHKFAPTKSFDVMLMTDSTSKALIEQLPIISSFTVDYFLMPSPTDPVVASVNKLKIVDYPRLNEYKRILVMDTDVIFTGNINEIFDTPIADNTLDVTPVIGGSPISQNHSLRYFSDEELQNFVDKKWRPFNCGHFMWNNTKRMTEHLKTVYWLYTIWPGWYFYEQSFMNQYFGSYVRNTVDTGPLNKLIQIGLEDKPSAIGTHFIGGGTHKLQSMNDYLVARGVIL